MSDVLIALALVLVAAAATAAVLNRDPARQALVLSLLGLSLALVFVLVQAPDVALSQLAVGSAFTPLMVLLAVRKVTREPRKPREGPGRGGAADGEGSGGSRGDQR